jgi:hypothetical protein
MEKVLQQLHHKLIDNIRNFDYSLSASPPSLISLLLLGVGEN